MNRFVRTAFLNGLNYGILMSIFFWIFISIFFLFIFGVQREVATLLVRVGIVVALGNGISCGLTIATFVYILSKGETARISLYEGETLIKDGPASHFLEWKAVGGWLFLTDRRFLFKSHFPHFLNVQNYLLELPLDSIVGAFPTRTFNIVPNSFKVTPNQGNTEQFVVKSRKKWVRLINQASTQDANF